MSEKTAKQIISCAADHIEKFGLLKDGFWTYDNALHPVKEGPCCTWGAMMVCDVSPMVTFPQDAEKSVAYAVAMSLLRDKLDEIAPGTGIPGWNDAPERTKEEVVAFLRSVAEVAP